MSISTAIEIIVIFIMAAQQKRRKVDAENRAFKDEWTYEYAFIFNSKSSRPMCLICNFSTTVVKKTNISRHFQTNHPTFDREFPPNSEKRAIEIKRLKGSVTAGQQLMGTFLTVQERATIASLKISWRLGKHMKPFKDAEIVKECMVDAMESIIQNPAGRDKVLTKVKGISLSNDTATIRSEKLSGAVMNELIQRLKEADCLSLAVDESTDKTNDAQLLVYVRYHWNESYHEDVLGLQTMKGRTTGADIYEAIADVLRIMEVDATKIVSITTDGAPAMVGRLQGMVTRLKEEMCPRILTYHCIIHQTVLCAGLGDRYKSAMDTIMKLVNYLRATSALRHRNLRTFLHEVGAQFDDLLLHNNVRWLSKGKVLARFWAIRDELQQFLSEDNSAKAVGFKEFLADEAKMNTIAFLVDITGHLNDVNLQLQGRSHTICDLVSSVNAFQEKLRLYLDDLILSGEKLFFPTLKAAGSQGDHTNFMNGLIDNFAARFDGFILNEALIAGIANPFNIRRPLEFSNKAKSIFDWVSVAALTSEVIDFQHDITVKGGDVTDPVEFWAKISIKSKPVLKKLATTILTMFGSTYTCEAGFSNMNFIKNKHRSRLTDTHLRDLMRISLTNLTPNFKEIAKSSVCHLSH